MSTTSPELQQYIREAQERGERYANDITLREEVHRFHQLLINNRFAYNSFWCGIPVIQDPGQMIARQQLIWELRPDCIIETGVAWGGSLMFSASMLAVLVACGLVHSPCVIGIDIDIRPHNLQNIRSHPLAPFIRLVQGSSTSPHVMDQVKCLVGECGKQVLVILDSNHTHAHVLEELRLYAGLVPKGSYIIVDDTAIEDFEGDPSVERPWGKGNSPKSAVYEFLQECDDFVIDKEYENRLLLLSTSDGWLKRIR